MTTTHDRAAYRRGCRCEVCCEANRVYAREHKRRKKSEIPVAATAPAKSGRDTKPFILTTTSPAESDVTPRGRVVEAVARDLASCNAFDERPGLAATAMAMAELLDNPSATPQWPAAAARLTAILMEVVPAVPVRASGLAAVREMTR